jgi:hypothetical protein
VRAAHRAGVGVLASALGDRDHWLAEDVPVGVHVHIVSGLSVALTRAGAAMASKTLIDLAMTTPPSGGEV